jgi:hypothetical protein
VRSVLKYLLIFIVALVVGIGTAWWALTGIINLVTIKNGPWRVNLNIGTSQTGMYLKAGVARVGLFALNKSEAVYFVALEDSGGQPLSSNCDYRITGRDFDARWWSITVYGEDFHLIANEKNRYSYFGGAIARNEKNEWTVKLSSKPQEGNWLPAGDNKQLVLNLRLYRPGESVYRNPDTIELPRIVKEECK